MAQHAIGSTSTHHLSQLTRRNPERTHRVSTSLELEHGMAVDPPSPPAPGHTRTLSGSSLIVPLALARSDSLYDAPGTPGAPASAAPERHLTLVSSSALVVGMIVGSGIFSSPGVIVALTGSVGASLAVWLVGGLLAWTGASSYAELGSAIPLDGGTQVYLAYAYGPLVSYLFVWTAALALKPGSAAIISIVMGEYVNRLLWQASTNAAGEVILAPEWSIKVTAVVAVALTALLNMVNPTAGSKAQVYLTAIKVTALAAVIILGIVSLIRNGAGPALSEGLFAGTTGSPAKYAIAIYSSLWAFEGWDSSNYVTGQMKNPIRDLPRTIHLSMATTVMLYLLINVSYFIVLPMATVASSNTVVLDWSVKLFGTVGASVFSIIVAISCFGSLNAGFYTTSRLIYAAAKEHLLPTFFAHLASGRQTPDRAILFQSFMTAIFIVFGGGFRRLVSFFSVANWTFFFATVLGLLVLRVKEPTLERPYRANVATPIIFCAVALFLLVMPIVAAPIEAAAAFGFILAGIPAYYILVKNQPIGGGPSAGQSKIRAAWNNMLADLRAHLPARLGGTASSASRGAYDRIEMTEVT